ncbi:MAG: type I 3-dehydroquinate dehydratase [Promethearchaeota archaeon]
MMLCVSLTEKSSKECVIFASSCDVDMIEHRLDFMDQIEDLDLIYSSSEKPIIATCRPVHEGGRFMGDDSRRVDYLLEALQSGASYIDIELDTHPSLITSIRNQTKEIGAQMIISKHYQGSPPLDTLTTALDAMKSQGADIGKIVTTPNSIKDCWTALQLYTVETRGSMPLISFAMGDLGKFTRVSALFLGAPFMYVAQDSGAAAAPGQIPLSKMRAILEALQ